MNINEMSDETFEAIGRAAMGMLQGKKVGDTTSLDEYVMRTAPDDREAVREILENVVTPLCELKPLHGKRRKGRAK